MQQEENNQEAFTPIKMINQTYTMCGKKFQIFSLNGFDFKSPIDIGEGCGLYCFTNIFSMVEIDTTSIGHRIKNSHNLLYLGKSDDFTKRPYQHNKLNKLTDAEYIGVYYCDESEDPKKIESDILAIFFFRENKQENEEQGVKKSIVVEDSVNLLKP